MKTAVVYYSYEGNSAFIAEQLKSRLNADIAAIQTKDEKKRSGFAKFAWGGSQVFMHKKPALKAYTFDPAQYDLIVIGTPVWAGSPAPAITSFLSQTKISGKKIALYVCHAGGKGSALEKFKALLPGNTFAGEIDFSNPASGNIEEIIQKIDSWVREISG
jgi:flavodoxin